MNNNNVNRINKSIDKNKNNKSND